MCLSAYKQRTEGATLAEDSPILGFRVSACACTHGEFNDLF